MQLLALLPFILQGAAMFFDEFYFHRKRGLPLWERIGHPLDTLSVFCVYLIPFFASFNKDHLTLFIGVALFSSLLVTKDEFVHAKSCEPREQWLHSLLFVLHPLQFVSAALFWAERDGALHALNIRNGFAELVLNGQLLMLIGFLFYQLIYWNIIWQPKTLSTITSTTVLENGGIQQVTTP